MNLCETEALTFDPESRRRLNLQLLMIFFFGFFLNPPTFFSLSLSLFSSGSVNVHGAFLGGKSLSYGKRKTSMEEKHQAGLLTPFHAWTQGLQNELHTNTLKRDQEESGRHSTSFSWTSFIACWRTIQPILCIQFPLYWANVQASHVCVICRGCWLESHKLCHRMTFQTLMISAYWEQTSTVLIVHGGAAHVSICNQEMLYLYPHWFNKGGELVLERMHHYSRAVHFDTVTQPNRGAVAAYCVYIFLWFIFLSMCKRDGTSSFVSVNHAHS